MVRPGHWGVRARVERCSEPALLLLLRERPTHGYELLEALPDDDAEGLRIAFRKAAKANHPDFNPGNPDASETPAPTFWKVRG